MKTKYKILYIENVCSPAYTFKFNNNILRGKNYKSPTFSYLDYLFVSNFELKVFEFQDSIVYPGTGTTSIFDNNRRIIYLPRSYNPTITYLPQEFRRMVSIKNRKLDELVLFENDEEPNYIESGIDLTDAIDNYHHIIVETLPKIVAADACGIPDNVPIIIPEGLHVNFVEAIKSVTRNRSIIKVKSYDLFSAKAVKQKIGKLYNVLSHYNNCFHPVKNVYQYPLHTSLNPAPIRETIKRVLQHFNIEPNPDPNVRLIIKRNSERRVSKDQKKLIKFAKTKGFQVVEPEKMSFYEQVKLMARASKFISFSGAACANTLFMHEDSQKILLLNPSGYMIASFWDTMLSSAYILENDVKDRNELHCTPRLSEKNWEDIKNILEGKFAFKEYKADSNTYSKKNETVYVD